MFLYLYQLREKIIIEHQNEELICNLVLYLCYMRFLSLQLHIPAGSGQLRESVAILPLQPDL